MTVELRTGFEAERIMKNIALYLSRPRQRHFLRTDLALNTAAHQRAFRANRADDLAMLPNAKAGALYVTVNYAVDLHLALTGQVARDREVRADNCWRRGLTFALTFAIPFSL